MRKCYELVFFEIHVICVWLLHGRPGCLVTVDRISDTMCHTYIASKGNGKGVGTCYSAAYMGQTHEQQRCIISEVAADWHESVVSPCIMWPSIAGANGQLYPRCS